MAVSFRENAASAEGVFMLSLNSTRTSAVVTTLFPTGIQLSTEGGAVSISKLPSLTSVALKNVGSFTSTLTTASVVLTPGRVHCTVLGLAVPGMP